VNNKIILVTGAAGSIGSEISRQLSKYNHKHLILIDQAESDLYELQQELIQNKVHNFTAIVADVRDKLRMQAIFKEHNPQKVFHAAAYKHVPLMEDSPYEAVKINIQGTKNIADLSLEYDIERFVMVSTDKAVNPTNVMGATKRVAEKYITCLSKKNSTTKFTITRFGNVLGSNGSVIPLFKKQLENGGPLTVTHKEITRYFMTIPEACRLVLEAGTMGDGGEVYIFDMGKSVKIFDVAKKMIHLSGYKYPEDIDIEITGLRPGEKLFEELLASGENTISTYHEKIMIAKTDDLNVEHTLLLVDRLCNKNKEIDNKSSVSIIKELVPEYISNNSIYEKLDKPGSN
jgi:FlaA1/EpsC-like NDP-sugar epimerase